MNARTTAAVVAFAAWVALVALLVGRAAHTP